eukprot:7376077-Prymnesium_polylepis.2
MLQERSTHCCVTKPIRPGSEAPARQSRVVVHRYDTKDQVVAHHFAWVLEFPGVLCAVAAVVVCGVGSRSRMSNKYYIPTGRID